MIWDNQQIRDLRLNLDLTQTEFAEILGCRQQTISEWEQGIYVPGNAYGKLLDQLAQGVTVATQTRSKSILKNHIVRQSAESQTEYRRPFDPTID